jgi:CubicO group peptidase (beta-lactamase class C family)
LFIESRDVKVDLDVAGPEGAGMTTTEPGRVEPGQVEPGWVEPGQMEPGQMEPSRMEPGWVEPWRRPDVLSAEIPSSGGVGNASALARMYAACIGPVDGVRLLDDATIAAAAQPQSTGPDAVLGVDTEFGLGYMVGASLPPACGPHAFGHPGAGGSLAFADPDAGLGFGYVTNRMLPDGRDPRAARLVAAAYRAAARQP